MQSSPLRRLSLFLDQAVGSQGPRIDAAQRLANVWRDVGGEALAKHTLSVFESSNVVVIHADSSLWANKIRHQQNLLLRGLQMNGYSNVAELLIRVAPVSGRRPDTNASPQLSSENAELLRKVASSLTDERLCASLTKLARRGKSENSS